jgi:hypothetical protein
MNTDLERFIDFFFLATMAVGIVTVILRPRVCRISEWPRWLVGCLIAVLITNTLWSTADLAGFLPRVSDAPQSAFLAIVWWFAIIRVWLRRDPTDRWLFYVPPVPDSLRRKHWTEL